MDISKPYEELVDGFLQTHKYQETVAGGAGFHYLLCGTGETTLVFLVGGMGLSYLYMPYIEALESEYRILTFEYPFECSNNEELVDRISDLLTLLDIPQAVFVGSSYGGYVAQCFARKYPQQTAGLCLFSTASLSEKTINELGVRYRKKMPMFMWMLRHLPYSWLKPSMIKACMKHVVDVSPEVYAYIKELFRFVYRDYTRELDMHMTTLLFDLTNLTPCTKDDFAYLDDHILLILPENDDSFTPEMQKELTGMMPKAVVVEGVDSGHLATLLETDRYVDEIRKYTRTVMR